MLVDAQTMRLAHRRVSFGTRLELRLKGKAAVEEAYPVLGGRETVGERWEVGGRRTPLVGRERDLERVLESWQRAQGGEGQLLTLVGEAGVGKSRLLAEVLERMVAPGDARVMAAQAIVEMYPVEEYLEIIAYHYSKTDEHGDAAWLERAGDYAASIYANAGAIEHYEEARRRHVLSGAEDRTLARLDEKLGTVLTRAGRYDAALGVLEHAAETYRAREDLESLARVTARIRLVHTGRGTPDERVETLRPLAEILEAHGPSHGLVMLYAHLADLLFTSGRYREELVAAERAVELARTIGDDGSLAEALEQHGVAHLAMGHLAEARRALEGAVALSEAAHDPDILIEPLLLLSLVFLRYGELDKSKLYCERGLALAEQLGYMVYLTAGTTRRGIIAYLGGDWSQARRDGEQALAWGRQLGMSWASARPRTTLGLVCYGEGRWEDARRYLQERMATRVGQQPPEHFAPGVLAECDVREGHPEHACARLAPLLEEAGREEVDVSLLLPPYAWAHLELGAVAAAAIVGRAITDARARNDRLNLVDALRVQALVALCQHQWTAAEQALEEGITLAQSMPYPYAEVRLLHVYGQMHLQRGEPGPARERLEVALAIFRRLGACKDVERVEQAIAEALGEDVLVESAQSEP